QRGIQAHGWRAPVHGHAEQLEDVVLILVGEIGEARDAGTHVLRGEQDRRAPHGETNTERASEHRQSPWRSRGYRDQQEAATWPCETSGSGDLRSQTCATIAVRANARTANRGARTDNG